MDAPMSKLGPGFNLMTWSPTLSMSEPPYCTPEASTASTDATRGVGLLPATVVAQLNRLPTWLRIETALDIVEGVVVSRTLGHLDECMDR